MESSDSKLSLLLETDLFSFTGEQFKEVAAHNESGYRSIMVEIGQKGSEELFKLPLVA